MGRSSKPKSKRPSANAAGSLLAFAVLVAAVALVFGRACGFDFVSLDDWNNVRANPLLNPPTPGSLAAFWRSGYEALFIPVTYTFWGLLAWLFRSDKTGLILAGPFHAANLALHAANSCLVYLLVRSLLELELPEPPRERPPGGPDALWWPCLLGALVFAVHPAQVEPVVWVTGTKDVLSAFLGFLALREAWRWAQLEGKPGRGPCFLRASLAYALALLAKPSSVALAPLAYVLLGLARRKPAGDALKVAAGWSLVALPVIVCNSALQIGAQSSWIPSWGQRPRIALDALGFYVALVFWPAHLAVDHGRTPQLVLSSGGWLYPALGAALLAGGAALLLARRVPACAALSFAAVLSPVLGLVPFGFQEYSTVAERYAYVAFLGPSLAVAWLLARYPTRFTRWTVCLVILALAGRSGAQVGAWSDSRSLYETSLAVNPGSAWLRNAKAHEMMEDGRDAEAIPVLQKALELRPGYLDGMANLALAKAKSGRLEEGVVEFRQLLRTAPLRADVHQNLGEALVLLHREAEAEAEFAEALRLDPGSHEAHDALGLLYARRGEFQKALRHFAQATTLRPLEPKYRAHAERALRTILDRGETPR